jgi:hypothetical protein
VTWSAWAVSRGRFTLIGGSILSTADTRRALTVAPIEAVIHCAVITAVSAREKADPETTGGTTAASVSGRNGPFGCSQHSAGGNIAADDNTGRHDSVFADGNLWQHDSTRADHGTGTNRHLAGYDHTRSQGDEVAEAKMMPERTAAIDEREPPQL